MKFLITVISVVATFFASSSPLHALNSSALVQPGISLFQTDPTMGGYIICTAGFRVRNHNQVGFLTAGHCDINDAGPVYIMNYSGRMISVGRWGLHETTFINPYLATDGDDIGVVWINPGINTSPIIYNSGVHVTRVLQDVTPTTVLFKSGSSSGVSHGKVVSQLLGIPQDHNKIFFISQHIKGDSGAPIYTRVGHSYYAVAILNGGMHTSSQVIVGNKINEFLHYIHAQLY